MFIKEGYGKHKPDEVVVQDKHKKTKVVYGCTGWCHPVIIVISVLLHRSGNLLQMWNKPEIERLYGYDLVSVSCVLSDNLNMYIYTEYVTNSTGL